MKVRLRCAVDRHFPCGQHEPDLLAYTTHHLQRGIDRLPGLRALPDS